MPYHMGRRRDHPSASTLPPRPCEWVGCSELGAYPAPRSPREAEARRWFCLEHVRSFNATWNYYDGMSEAEIDADRRCDMVWRRPTWRMGGKAPSMAFGGARVHDDFGLFRDDAVPPPRRPAPTPELEALMVLDLTPPVTVPVVKARYKELVKRHHPDANGGDKQAEERFKLISAAYRTVLSTLTG